MAIRWKMEPKETGLRGAASWPRSHWLRDGDTRLACASPSDRSGSAWYWVAGWDAEEKIPHMNTCGTPVASIKEAKDAAMNYVRQRWTK